MTMNTNLLLKLHENICDSQNALKDAFEAIYYENKEVTQERIHKEETQKSSDPILQKLFGVSSYRYRFRLKHKFPSLIYKERNMGLSVQLVDLKGKMGLNSNLINLCLAVCDVYGQWISENEEGSCFLKGKTEVELYHGEISFQKIWPRRSYPKGNANIVIYSEPSLIKFSSTSSFLEERVNALEIEPLLQTMQLFAPRKNPLIDLNKIEMPNVYKIIEDEMLNIKIKDFVNWLLLPLFKAKQSMRQIYLLEASLSFF